MKLEVAHRASLRQRGLPAFSPAKAASYPANPPPEKKHNVPAIHHLPTNTHIIDSTPSPNGTIELQARSVVGPTFRASVVPREINILSLRSQEYFRRTREAALGRKLEDCLMRRRRAGRLSVRE
ncbi:hypothetical protein VC83_09450 [Pseudogymnoascus destructans]|uniref:Glutathione S-transferase UstS-like C-terminal domain-containing protein n=1 Tax=Pseudogymnoascus destructans TaxID=655981 RepID=A0A176ZWK0_9PEZI|nr:uncharacterized protein VC83_09450 [Pseudogymnoascus destructans]OAF54345.1 hypothetical protein VC83_09450 [Pseudogymnoascus destructans]